MILRKKFTEIKRELFTLFAGALVILALSGVLAGINFYFNPPVIVSAQAVEAIGVRQAKQLNPVWVDARDDRQYQLEHIPGAVQVDIGKFSDGLFNLAQSWHGQRPIVVYCDGDGCESSKAVAEKLVGALGVEKVYYLEGGFPAWKNQ